MHALATPVAFRLAPCLPRVRDGAVEQPPVLGRELVCGVGLLALRERGVRVEVVADVAAAALDEVPRQPTPLALVLRAREIVREVREARVEQREQRPEGVLLAAVRRRGDEDQVASLVCGELGEQLVAQLPAAVAAEREAVRLVDDHQLRAGRARSRRAGARP